MSLLTQFYPSSGSVSYAIGSYPGIWASEPTDPNDPPSQLLSGWGVYGASGNPSGLLIGNSGASSASYQKIVYVGGVTSESIGLSGSFREVEFFKSTDSVQVTGTFYGADLNSGIQSPNLERISGLYVSLTAVNTYQPSGQASATLSLAGNSNLTTIEGTIYINVSASGYFRGTTSISFANCALTQESVDAVLVAIDASKNGNGTRTVDISGGTNAAPGTAGAAAVASLISAGYTVTTN